VDSGILILAEICAIRSGWALDLKAARMLRSRADTDNSEDFSMNPRLGYFDRLNTLKTTTAFLAE
jgi:hypothetical protein